MRYRLALFEKSAELPATLFYALKKSLCLSVSELGIFSEKESVRKVVGSHRPRSRFESFFVSFLAEQKGKSVSDKSHSFLHFRLNRSKLHNFF
jgi:hypothetical protein